MHVKQSPGPFKRKGPFQIVAADGAIIADVTALGFHTTEGNANLFAASADLLDLLALAIVLFEPECKGSMTAGWQWLQQSKKAVEAARSVRQGSTESGSAS